MKKLMCSLVVLALAFPMTAALAQGPGSSGVLFLLIAPGARGRHGRVVREYRG